MNGYPDSVYDQKFQRRLGHQAPGPERKSGKKRGVDGVGLGIDELQHHAAYDAGRGGGLDEGNLAARKGDTGGEVKKVGSRGEKKGLANTGYRKDQCCQACDHCEGDKVCADAKTDDVDQPGPVAKCGSNAGGAQDAGARCDQQQKYRDGKSQHVRGVMRRFIRMIGQQSREMALIPKY